MGKKDNIQLFEEKKVRTAWDEENEEWYFSIVDVVDVLTDSPNPRKYWSVLKTRLKKEGSELTTICSQLKMVSSDGKKYMTDVVSTQQLFRLIQSIPSPKAEPFKLWIAQVAKERLDQMQDPELSIEQAMLDYKGLKKENLRDNMTNAELVLNMLAELSTKQISEATDPDTMDEHARVAKQGGEVARNARIELEEKTGQKVISPLNAKQGILNKKSNEISE
jgi:prophage antirepressor-like protein